LSEQKVQLRQGDILLTLREPTEKVSFKGYKAKANGCVAEGEVTGHAHRLQTNSKHTLFENENDVLDMIVEVKDAPAEITHEDHGTLNVPPGVWDVTHQVEYTPERMRRVVD